MPLARRAWDWDERLRARLFVLYVCGCIAGATLSSTAVVAADLTEGDVSISRQLLEYTKRRAVEQVARAQEIGAARTCKSGWSKVLLLQRTAAADEKRGRTTSAYNGYKELIAVAAHVEIEVSARESSRRFDQYDRAVVEASETQHAARKAQAAQSDYEQSVNGYAVLRNSVVSFSRIRAERVDLSKMDGRMRKAAALAKQKRYELAKEQILIAEGELMPILQRLMGTQVSAPPAAFAPKDAGNRAQTNSDQTGVEPLEPPASEDTEIPHFGICSDRPGSGR